MELGEGCPWFLRFGPHGHRGVSPKSAPTDEIGLLRQVEKEDGTETSSPTEPVGAGAVPEIVAGRIRGGSPDAD